MTDEFLEDFPFACNICLRSLTDTRYKCLNCADFDLCEEVNTLSLSNFLAFRQLAVVLT